MGVVKYRWVWLTGVSYKMHDLLAFVVLYRILDAHDLTILQFPTYYHHLALTETPRTRDLAIFVMTTTRTTQPITLPLCTCARGKYRSWALS